VAAVKLLFAVIIGTWVHYFVKEFWVSGGEVVGTMSNRGFRKR
jgi:hypothetical protein